MPTRKKLLHVRSNRPLTGDATKPQLPESSFLDYGELAINYGEGIETLSIKNSENDIVTFSSDIYNSNTYTTKEETIENELVVATALTEHEDRLDGLDETVAGKQDALTFDSTPTASSLNPVTSRGIKEYVDNATDDTLVIECSGDLSTDPREAKTPLTITNNITAADVIEAYDDGKKIEIRHTYVHSGSFDDGCIITSAISSIKTQTGNNNATLIGTAINAGTPVLSAFSVDYRILYLLSVEHNEQDDTNDEISLIGVIMDHPVYIDGNNEGELILGWETLDGSAFAPKFRYYDQSTSGTGIVAYTTDLESITSMTEITYSDLVTARNNNNLKPGTWYRITDYTTTTTQADTQSAGHNFDVIVLATSSNTLSEEARAIKHDGDTYFANSNLNAWKVWYCLDNNKTKYNWADDSVDESTEESITATVQGGGGAPTSYYNCIRDTSKDRTYQGQDYYGWVQDSPSFTLYTKTENISIGEGTYTIAGGGAPASSYGVITAYTPAHEGTGLPNGRGVIYRLIDEWGNDCPYDFKNIQFKRKLRYNTSLNFYVYDETNGTDTWVYTFNAGFGETLYDNSLGLNLNVLGGNGIVGLCFNNTILPCYDIGNYSNVIAGTAGEIILNDTVFLSMVPENTNYLLGLVTSDNSIDVNNRNNTLYGNNLTIGKGFEYNVFISASLFAQVGNGNSTFGNGCKHFHVTEPMDHCTFGNDVQYFSVTQTADGGYKYIIVENGVQYVTLDVSGSNRSIIQNITIAQGVAGDSNNTKVIYHNTGEDNFQTIYRSINSQVVTV